MLKKTLKEMQESTLWLVLADISEIMGNNHHGKQTEVSNFWLSVATEVNNEINNRLFDAADDLDDCED